MLGEQLNLISFLETHTIAANVITSFHFTTGYPVSYTHLDVYKRQGEIYP